MTIPADTLDSSHMIFGRLFSLANRLETIGSWFLDGLTSKQWFLMAALTTFFDGSATLSQLSGVIGTSHQNVKQLVLKLEAKGFVTLKRDPEDRRSILVSPTPHAAEYEKAYQEPSKEFLDKLYSGISPEELAQVCRILSNMDNNLTKIQEENR